jgi:acyl transferase domain-containing protein
MMAVGLSAEKTQPYLNKLESTGQALRVSVACINGPKGVTISGDRGQITEILAWLKEDKVFARVLPIPVAYHSYQMEEIAIAYKESIGDDRQLSLGRRDEDWPRMVSSVTSEYVQSNQLAKADYWVTNLLSTVRFLDAFRKVSTNASRSPTKKLDGSHRHHMAIDSFLEIGPHAAMRGPCRDILRDAGRNTDVQYFSLLTRNTCGVHTTLDTMAQLHCLGYPIDLNAVNSVASMNLKDHPKVLTNLPPYSFNHSKSYWREGPISKGFRFRRFGRHEMLGWPDDDWNPLLPKWNNTLQPSDPIWVRDHQVRITGWHCFIFIHAD